MYVGNVSEMFVFNVNLYFGPYQISMIWGSQDILGKKYNTRKIGKIYKDFLIIPNLLSFTTSQFYQ